jgi:SAM-dependent methyltransferase
MSERRGLWSPLANPLVYEAFHHLIGARRWLKRFADNVICVQRGERLLDIGCGPGALLRYLPEWTTYIGFDRNPSYIQRAKRTYGSRGEFICDDVSNFTSHALAPTDIAVAYGILHHLDDELACHLLRSVANALKPGGRLITVDPCFHARQSVLQRLIVSNDRGMHVRPFEQYVDLCGEAFHKPEATYQNGHIPFPHSICIVQATRAST